MTVKHLVFSLTLILITACVSPAPKPSSQQPLTTPPPSNPPRVVINDENGSYSLPLIVVKAGGRSFNIPIINGYHDLRTLSPKEYEEAERDIPDPHKLLVALVDSRDGTQAADGQDLGWGSYIVLTVNRKFEYAIIHEGIYKHMHPLLKENYESPPEKYYSYLTELFTEAATELSQGMGEAVKYEMVSDPTPLGVFHESENSIGAMFMVDTKFETEDKSLPISFLLSQSVVRVNNRVLNIEVFLVQEENFIEWCKQVTSAWINAILAVNKD